MAIREKGRVSNRGARMRGVDLLGLAVWLGLAAGLAAVATRLLLRWVHPVGRLAQMTRHYLWLTPLSNVVLLVTVALGLLVLVRLWPRLGNWLSPRILVALALLPPLMVAVPNVFPEAWFLLTLGIAARIVPRLQANPPLLRSRLWKSLPVLAGAVLVLASTIFVGDWLSQRRERNRPLPRTGSPNVLLIVMDTVRQDRLSLYGYHRPTSPTLEGLAKRGILFDSARAAAPWTLPSHASLFTGRWPHELRARWVTPLLSRFPTLAEYLGACGYATAGFVSNVQYCSYDSGLSRGFTYYEDYVLEGLNPLRTSVVVNELYDTIIRVSAYHQESLTSSIIRSLVRWFGNDQRRDATSINHGFLSWLDRRPQPERPFFAFLNYMDAHNPYLLPQGVPYRFGISPQDGRELWVMNTLWPFIDKLTLPRAYLQMAGDCYDNCIAYMDHCMEGLLEELERRGQLDRTWIVITSDHGEGLGEHDLFLHGETLYATETHVPLLIVPPRGTDVAAEVSAFVSLRQVPATLVDVLGLKEGSPFPGQSLAPFWTGNFRAGRPGKNDGVLSELPEPNPTNPNQGRSPVHRGPLVSLAEENHVYIRNDGDGSEQLFDEKEDPRELIDLAGAPTMKPTLERLRARVDEIRSTDVDPESDFGF